MLKVLIILALACGSLALIPNSVNQSSDKFIIGGQNAVVGQFPYAVQVRRGSRVCGGVFIQRRWVVTTADCLVGGTIHGNVFMIFNVNLGALTVRFDACTLRRHPEFNPETLENNIAMVLLCGSLENNPNFEPIPLSTQHIGGGVDAVVTGWGFTSFPGSNAPVLQFLNVTTLTNSDCRSRLTATDAARVFDENICAFTPGGGICTGDSGAPLVSNGEAIGIASWSVPCAAGYPDVYVRITDYHAWIMEILRQGPR